MRITKRGGKLRVLMAALPVAGIMTVASAAVVGLTPGLASADTTGYTVTCTGVPVINTAAFGSQITGTISPSPVDSGSTFSLNNFVLDITVPGTLVGIATASGPGEINTGTVQFNADATGATPATSSVSGTIPDTTLTSAEDTTGATIAVPLTSPTWTASGTATTAAVSADVTYSVGLTLNGTAVPAFSCTAPTEQIDSASITPTPFITATPNSYAFVGPSDSTMITVSGGNWKPSSTVNLGWATGTDSGSCLTDTSGTITGTCQIPASMTGEVGTAAAPFSDNVLASGENNASVAATAHASVFLTPFVSLDTFCNANSTGLGQLQDPSTATSPENPQTITRGASTASTGYSTATPLVPNPPDPYVLNSGGVGCDPKQQIDANVLGSYLYIWQSLSPANAVNPYAKNPPTGDAAHVILSPVQLGLDLNNSAEGGNLPACSPFAGNCSPAVNNGQFDQALGQLNTVTVQDDRGTLSGWTVTGQMETDFNNQAPIGPAPDNVIPADFLTWEPNVALTTPGTLPASNANTPACPDQSTPPLGFPACTGPSGTPAANNTVGGAPINGTEATGVTGDSVPAEVFAGTPETLNNLHGSADVLCATDLSLAGQAAGGGGSFNCGANLVLAVPPYVAAGDYRSVMDITILGF